MASLLKNNSLLVKILVSGLILAFLCMRMDFAQMDSLAGNIHPSVWLAALTLIFCQIFALALRWMWLINVNGRKMNYNDSVRVTLASQIANYLFITSIGGVIVRVALAVQHGVPFVQSVAATAADRMMTLLALALLGVLFLPVLAHIVEPSLYRAACMAILICCLGFAAFWLFFMQRLRRTMIFSRRRLAVGYKYLRNLMTDHGRLAGITVISLAAQASYFGAVYMIVLSLGADFPLISFMAVMPIITIIASLPVGYGGWGIREGAFVYGLGLIGMPLETAFIASVQIGFISMLAALLAVLPEILNGGFSFSFKDPKPGRKAGQPG